MAHSRSFVPETAKAEDSGSRAADHEGPEGRRVDPLDRYRPQTGFFEEILELVNGRRGVSMAAGELLDAKSTAWEVPVGVRYVKFGLSQCGSLSCWASVLCEMREHLRFFQLALEGRDDLLGRRAPGASTGDGVLPVRWVE